MSGVLVFPTNGHDISTRWLQDILQESRGKFTIKSFTVDHSVNEGHGVVSNTLAVNLIGHNGEAQEDEVVRLVVKFPSDHPILKQLAEQFQFDYRETMMYTVFLKDLHQFSRERGAESCAFEAPRCYYGRADPLEANKTVLVLENLRYDGYQMADYERGLDYQHLSVAVKEIGRFHGNVLAMKMLKNIGNFKDLYPFLMKTDVREISNPYIISGFRYTVQFLKEEGVEEQVIRKLVSESKAQGFIERFLEPTGDLACVNHADCTGRNLMFRYDERGRPVTCKLLDFQACMYASTCTNDFWLLLLCSGDVKERKTHAEALRRDYLSSLESTVRGYGLSEWHYPKEQFQNHLRLGHMTAMLHCISGAQVWFGKSEAGKERLLSMIMEAEEEGLLDELKRMEIEYPSQ